MGYNISSQKNAEKAKLVREEYLLNPSLCQKCFSILEYKKRNNTFCSSSCSAKGRDYTKINLGGVKNIKIAKKASLKKSLEKRIEFCQNVGFPFKGKYKILSRFKFSLNSFTEEFDFNYINKFGMFKSFCPKGGKLNIEGLVRDHMFSVSDGIKNFINPKIISHPANCKLIFHFENSRKQHNSNITLEQLLEKIKNWDLKYGNFYKNNEIEKVYITEEDLDFLLKQDVIQQN